VSVFSKTMSKRGRAQSILKQNREVNDGESDDTNFKIIYDYIKKEEMELDKRLQNDKEKPLQELKENSPDV
jgi:hypothetical protein